jgi:predicted membrane metal-binding protein
VTRVRVLPAHVIALACVAGLASANALRLHGPVSVLLGSLAVSLAVPRGPARLSVAAAVMLVASWWWGSVRLGQLDQSALAPRIGTAARMEAVVTGEARVGSFAQRQFARTRCVDGRPVDERVQLELPLGRAPPQGAVISLLAVIEAPRGPAHGFDERTWLRRQGIHVVLHVDAWTLVGHRGGLGGAADALRDWLRHASSPGLRGQRRAVVEGVLLGDDGGLSDNVKQAFRRSGLYHLLAPKGQSGHAGLCAVLGAVRTWACAVRSGRNTLAHDRCHREARCHLRQFGQPNGRPLRSGERSLCAIAARTGVRGCNERSGSEVEWSSFRQRSLVPASAN